MYRTKLPANIIVSKKTQEDIKELLKNKSSGKSQEDIYNENKERLKVLEGKSLEDLEKLLEDL